MPENWTAGAVGRMHIAKITGQMVTLSEEHKLALAEAEDCERDGAWAEQEEWSLYAKKINPDREVFSHFVWEVVTLSKEVAMIEAMMQQCTTDYSRKMYKDYLNSLVN